MDLAGYFSLIIRNENRFGVHMVEAIKQAWADIQQGENIDLYLTLTIALILAGLSLFGIGQSMLGSITLAVLALLTFSSLVNRRKLEETVEKLNRDQNALLDRFPTNREEHMKGAKELWLVGLTLNKTISNYYSLLLENLKQGDHVRVLIVNPGSVYGSLIAQRKFSHDKVSEIRTYQQLTLKRLMALKTEKSLKPELQSNLEVRLTNYPPFFGAIALELDSTEGVIYIEHYSYQMEDDLPKLEFRQNDTKWFQFYGQQIKKMWSDSEAWDFTQLD
jgi:hypothetical protein